MAGRATVSLKVIITKEPSDFSTAVTKATNTQNEVKTEDFVAIDMVQRRLRQDFAVYLKKEYIYRRSEPVPTPEAGTSVLRGGNGVGLRGQQSRVRRPGARINGRPYGSASRAGHTGSVPRRET